MKHKAEIDRLMNIQEGMIEEGMRPVVKLTKESTIEEFFQQIQKNGVVEVDQLKLIIKGTEIDEKYLVDLDE